MTITRDLAKYALGVNFKDLPKEVVHGTQGPHLFVSTS